MKLNTFHLKIIAVIAMVIDHIADTMLPTDTTAYLIMRIVGRISAPIFWFCLAEGYKHTSNRVMYASRLATASLIMMFGNALIGAILRPEYNITLTTPNIFLTLFFALIAIECFDRSKKDLKQKRMGHFPIGLLFVIVAGLYTDYGWTAVLSILCFYFIKDLKWRVLLFAAINIAFSFMDGIIVQAFASIAALILIAYSDEKPKYSAKQFFYWFYPIHLWLFIIIGHFLK